MGYNIKRHSAVTSSRQIATDVATLNFVRLITDEIRICEHVAQSEKEFSIIAANRRFVGRIVSSASDGVRAQLSKEGTWIVLFFVLILRGPIFASTDSLPPRAELFATLRAFHAETAEANAASLNVSTRYSWLHWLPSIGFTFGKPSVNFSLSQVANNIETKAQRTAERTKILRGSNLAFRADSFALVAQLERIDNARDALPSLLAAERTENQRFEIEKELNAKGLLPAPFGWLDAQAANLRSGEAVRIKLEEIELLEIEARKTAKY